MENIKCARFIDMYDEEITNVMQESYWENNFDTEKIMIMIESWARDNDYVLIDIDNFDYDKYLTNFYKSIEKGLS